MDKFILQSNYKPMGDQPDAIEKLAHGIKNGLKDQVLLGVTGSGKTFTMANVIEKVNRPTLVLAHNKTLAAQLCSEFREFFPENAVEYFVSYYDYYQPEAYIPGKDLYIEKDFSINDEVERLRHSATASLLERRDVIIVSSVSCIYTLGNPADYKNLVISLRPNMYFPRNKLIEKLVEIQYQRNDMDFSRNKFRVRGDTVDIFPSNHSETGIRIEYFGDEIDRISEINSTTGRIISLFSHVAIYPATHYVTEGYKKEEAINQIYSEMIQTRDAFIKQGKLIEAQRIEERVNYDMEMIKEIGYCSGIENYSRFFSGKAPGSTPYTLMDYFPDDFLLIIDESHVTLPQVHGMSAGDYARKKNLIDFGFRLPSAFDNRPLRFEEFENKTNQVIYVSATPADYETKKSEQTVEQIIRPTGLLDPVIDIRPAKDQVDDLIGELNETIAKNERCLVITLTKKMAEDLTDYLSKQGVNVRYMHHHVETIERTALLNDLRAGKFDVLVGINLLREGLDLPEVSLVAVLDADKEGFLRSHRSLIQIIGRAARHEKGKVILYADTLTDSINKAVSETQRRRKIQSEYNEKHGIIPKSIQKGIRELPKTKSEIQEKAEEGKKLSAKEKEEYIEYLKKEMYAASKRLDFEYAASLRDKLILLQAKPKKK